MSLSLKADFEKDVSGLRSTAITGENIENSFTFYIENELAVPEMMYMIELGREVKYDFRWN